jgi:citrate lyase beta subunit
MKQVFVAKHPTEAYFVKEILEAEGIGAEVHNEALFGVGGEAPATAEIVPTVWVVSDSEVSKAVEVVNAFESGDGPEESQGPIWHCPKCGEEMESQYTECCQCGAIRPKS